MDLTASINSQNDGIHLTVEPSARDLQNVENVQNVHVRAVAETRFALQTPLVFHLVGGLGLGGRSLYSAQRKSSSDSNTKTCQCQSGFWSYRHQFVMTITARAVVTVLIFIIISRIKPKP